MLNALKEYVEFDEFSSIHKKNFSGMDQAVRTHRSVRFTDWDSTALDCLCHRSGDLSGSLPADHNLQQSIPLASDEFGHLSKPGERKFCSTLYEL